MQLILPDHYVDLLGGAENTEKAIKAVKDMFQNNLSAQLALLRVTAPMVVLSGTGLNDELNGVERPVRFPIRDMAEQQAEVVHSLAKWKRAKLAQMGIRPGRGIYTDMNALRPDEELDNIHSIYVDQWDWEKIIRREDRTLEYLKRTAQEIVHCVVDVSDRLRREFPSIHVKLKRKMACVTTQELEDMYPDFPDPKDREDAFLREHGTALIMQIGDKLRSGKPHDGRAPDYDDWQLNGDILFWNDVLGRAFEISSMGIRVDAQSLDRQLTLAGCDDRRQLPFHRMLLNDELPLTIGGGIGQSRLCMLMMGNAHIGEVQSSIWDEQTSRVCAENGILLL